MASGVKSPCGDCFPEEDIRKPSAAANEGDEGTEQQLPKIRTRGRNHGDQTWPSRKVINGIKQGQCQISSTDDEITQSLEIVSEEYEWPQSKNSLLLIEELRMHCKDSVSLLKIQDAVLAYERLIEFKKNHCRLLIRKAKHMENKVCRLHKKLSELREVKSQLEQQAVEWEQKCCSLRILLAGLVGYWSNPSHVALVSRVATGWALRLAAVSKDLRREKKLKRSLLSALTVRPVPEVPCCGNPENNLVLNRNLVVKENLVIPVSGAQPSNNSMDEYLTK
ncbi:ankyrin repeat domain-containing protein 26-like, partial [Ochotona curzoniae]|uniref:ankyrin repeat domain-containing protein 26-like n=1 Tax=Ochotona curzoniae TaxID=130825 RepID=UPI001B34F0C8